MKSAALFLTLAVGTVPAFAGDLGTFVDEAKCASCHAKEAQAWKGSHHDLAMQEPGATTVLGDFADASFAYGGVTTRFSRRGEAFVVNTDGPDGKAASFDVRYVFGVEPLQQVLLPLPAGRLQALSVAWDTGAKRWYHLYPDGKVDHRDELHWTKASQNWNFMCAECHSTDVEKNYDAAKDTYDTRFFRIDVGCQACHGPGARHVEWAEAHPDAKGTGANEAGLAVDLGAADRVVDRLVEVEACARCHARRSVIAPDYQHGRRLMDSHLPALLEEDLYFVDGQIREEVYEYASFEQSRMAAKGLRCTDCHDPHSGRTRAEGDALCLTCHNETGAAARAGIDTRGLRRKRYDTPEHHFHAAGAEGSRCLDCHAPSTTYMGVDRRADHSFRIPRPDLGEVLGVPNACNRCHTTKTAAWAAGEIRARVAGWKPTPHFATALHAGREGLPGAMRGLVGLAGDGALPPVVRATALLELANYPGESSARALRAGLVDVDPQARRAAVAVLASAPAESRAELLAPLLADPVRTVRIEAARALVAGGESGVAAERRAAWRAAVSELEASHRANADRPEGRTGLGDLMAATGRRVEAEAAYRAALALDPAFVPAAVNLADFHRALGEDARAEAVLREVLVHSPGAPSAQLALALTLVRLGRRDEALEVLRAAGEAEPGRADVAWTRAAALAGAGRRDDAVRVLEVALATDLGNRDLLLALASYTNERRYLDRLAAVNPEDPALPH